MAKRKSVVGFEDSGQIDVLHYDDSAVEIRDGQPVKITGTLGADPTVVFVRPVKIRNPSFDYRLLMAAGSQNYSAVEFISEVTDDHAEASQPTTA